MVGTPHPALAGIIAGRAGLMIDATGRAMPGLLAALGHNMPDVIASYVTGSDGVDLPAAEWNALAGKVGLFRYDQSPGLALFASGAADGADIERGAGTVGAFIDAARKREARGWHSWAYIDQADAPALQGEVKAAGLRLVQYGIANWNDSLAAATTQLGPSVAYVQWASPSSNPHTQVPGTTKTLLELNCDLNATLPGWFAVKHPVAPPGPLHGLVVVDQPATGLVGHPVTSADDGRTWAAAS